MGKVVREGGIQIFDPGNSSSNSGIHQRIGRIPVRPSQALLQDFG